MPGAQLFSDGKHQSSHLVSVVSSPLSKHVTSISTCELTSESLYILALRMPQLDTLVCDIHPSPSTTVILPHKLETLHLEVRKLAAAAINALLVAISKLTALAILSICLNSVDSAISFARWPR